MPATVLLAPAVNGNEISLLSLRSPRCGPDSLVDEAARSNSSRTFEHCIHVERHRIIATASSAGFSSAIARFMSRSSRAWMLSKRSRRLTGSPCPSIACGVDHPRLVLAVNGLRRCFCGFYGTCPVRRPRTSMVERALTVDEGSAYFLNRRDARRILPHLMLRMARLASSPARRTTVHPFASHVRGIRARARVVPGSKWISVNRAIGKRTRR